MPKGLDSKYTETNRLSNPVGGTTTIHSRICLLLVSFAHSQQSRYALVELIVARDGQYTSVWLALSHCTRVPSTSKPLNDRDCTCPKPGPLLPTLSSTGQWLSRPSHSHANSPDRQLQGDSRVLPATYEDVIVLRNNDTLEIVRFRAWRNLSEAGQEPEALRSHRHKTKNPAVILIIRGVGVVRVATSDVDRFISEKPRTGQRRRAS